MDAVTIRPDGTFCLHGRFLTFAPDKSSPYKYMTLATPMGERSIKLSKSLRLMLFRDLTPGDWVRVVGRQKIDKKDGGLRWKAQEVIKLPASPELDVPMEPRTPSISPPLGVASEGTVGEVAQPQRRKAKVLVCQKSDCRKRGSNTVCKTLAAALDALEIGDQVTIQETGCMDRCKAGPNVVIMPDKARYSRVAPAMVPELVQRHFTAKTG